MSSVEVFFFPPFVVTPYVLVLMHFRSSLLCQ